MIEVTFLTNGGKTVTAPENSNLLRVSLREQGGIPFKCGGGICGTCKCRIEKGLEHTDAIKPKERKHLTEEQFAELGDRCGLTCQIGARASWKARRISRISSALPPPHTRLVSRTK